MTLLSGQSKALAPEFEAIYCRSIREHVNFVRTDELAESDKINENKGRNRFHNSIMKPDTQKKLQEHLKAIAEILYQEAEAEELETLAGIERTIRAQTLN